MMLTQRISALAHDLARQCHVVGGGTSTQTEDKTSAGGKETSHRYSIARRREFLKLCIVVCVCVCVCVCVVLAQPK